MTPQSTGFLTEYLKIGSGVSLTGPSTEEQAAIVHSIAEDELWLEFSRRIFPRPFQVGDPVLLKFWDEGATVYSWDTKVKAFEGGNPEKVVLFIKSRVVNIQRRKSYRVRAQIPFDFSIVGAANTELIGKKVHNATTQNLSIGGLLFATQLPLEVGDKLELRIQVGPIDTVNAVGWVARHERPQQTTGHPTQLALRFLHVETEEQDRLLRFLKSYYD